MENQVNKPTPEEAKPHKNTMNVRFTAIDFEVGKTYNVTYVGHSGVPIEIFRQKCISVSLDCVIFDSAIFPNIGIRYDKIMQSSEFDGLTKWGETPVSIPERLAMTQKITNERALPTLQEAKDALQIIDNWDEMMWDMCYAMHKQVSEASSIIRKYLNAQN